MAISLTLQSRQLDLTLRIRSLSLTLQSARISELGTQYPYTYPFYYADTLGEALTLRSR